MKNTKTAKAELTKLNKLLRTRTLEGLQLAALAVKNLELRDADLLRILSPTLAYELLKGCDLKVWAEAIKLVNGKPKCHQRLLEAAIRKFKDPDLDSRWRPGNKTIEKCQLLAEGFIESNDEQLIHFWATAWGERDFQYPITELSTAQAKGLTGLRGTLWIYDMKQIGSDAALALSKYKGELIISLEILDDSPGNLALLETLLKRDLTLRETLEKKGSCGGASLGSVRSLSDAAVKVCVDAAAKACAKHKVRLEFDSLLTLSNASAQALAQHRGELSLNGLKSLSDTAAQSLAQHEGDLYLYGVENLSDASAQALARHKGPLLLYGLETLSQTAATELARHEGDLRLSDVAEALVKKARALLRMKSPSSRP